MRWNRGNELHSNMFDFVGGEEARDGMKRQVERCREMKKGNTHIKQTASVFASLNPSSQDSSCIKRYPKERDEKEEELRFN